MTKDKAIEKIEHHILFLAEYDVIDINIADTLVANIAQIVAKIDTDSNKDEDYTDISRYWQIMKKLKDSEDD